MMYYKTFVDDEQNVTLDLRYCTLDELINHDFKDNTSLHIYTGSTPMKFAVPHKSNVFGKYVIDKVLCTDDCKAYLSMLLESSQMESTHNESKITKFTI